MAKNTKRRKKKLLYPQVKYFYNPTLAQLEEFWGETSTTLYPPEKKVKYVHIPRKC